MPKNKIDKLDKRIKLASKELKGKRTGVIKVMPSRVKNKAKRLELVERKKAENNKNRRAERLKRQKIRTEQGEDALPKMETKTIESMRRPDETMIENDDEEIAGEEEIDEFA
jgi:ribosome production factor 1